ncbi:MAG: type VI secretion system tube protein Hcp [Arcobacter sp.]|nr:MAG: type VI secretion system tube protein Hcp [Arcobacter sp.]
MSTTYMSIKGSTQGLITEGAFTPESVGNRYQNGHEDEMLIESYSYGSSIPTDENGFISGIRKHHSLNILKVTDRSSPLLFEALNKGETLNEIELRLYRTSYEGKPEHYFTIELSDAVITNLSTNNALESIDFRYRKIELRHEISSTSSSDDLRMGMNKS